MLFDKRLKNIRRYPQIVYLVSFTTKIEGKILHCHQSLEKANERRCESDCSDGDSAPVGLVRLGGFR
jgi:hypothetical protein